MAFELPPLPYPYNALEPHIDEQTMRLHHDKHHAAYIAKANEALEKHPDLAKKSVEDLLRNLSSLPDSIRTVLNNHGGGHSNHTIFWEIMKPGGATAPSGELAEAIGSTFGSFDAFKEKLTAAAVGQFGSGWSWLALDSTGKLNLSGWANQDSPFTKNLFPLVGVDVWEHAYYLKYQNRRADYIAAWWNTVNWDVISKRYMANKK
jgi:Fe-Mn family superoxide dismutase